MLVSLAPGASHEHQSHCRVAKPKRFGLLRVRVRPDDLLAKPGQRRFQDLAGSRHWQRKTAYLLGNALLNGRARVGAEFGSGTRDSRGSIDLRRIARPARHERRTTSSNGKVSTWAPIEGKKPSPRRPARRAAAVRMATDDDWH